MMNIVRWRRQEKFIAITDQRSTYVTLSDTTPIPSDEELRNEYESIRCATYNGIHGVWYADSDKPGPVLGITILTHGNEPSGLAALWYMRHCIDVAATLQKGSVFFVLNNTKAAEAYFAALSIVDEDKRETTKRLARLHHHNMNRLPGDTLELKGDTRFEIYRAQELRPIWRLFDVGLDIHSTLQTSDPMIIACDGFDERLIKGFPIDIVITNIDRVQLGKPAISFYGTPGSVSVIGIEAGSHEDPQSVACAIRCARALMENLGMLAREGSTAQQPAQASHEYFVDGSVVLPDASYSLVKVFDMFEPIKRGQVLARGNGPDIAAPFDGHSLLGHHKLKPDFLGEEMMFLSYPVRKIIL